MIALLLAGTAWADCHSLASMVEAGMPLSEVLPVAMAEGPNEDTAACLEARGVPAAVAAAVRRGPLVVGGVSSNAPTVPPRTALQPEHMPDAPPLSPTGALGLSVAVGFGSGHFYAKRTELGLLFLLSQAAGVGLVYQGSTSVNLPMVQGGTALLVGSRLLEVATVGFVADHQAQAR